MARTIDINSLLGKNIPHESIIKQQHEADLEVKEPIDVVAETKDEAKETIKERSKPEGAGRQVRGPGEILDGNETGKVDRFDGNGDDRQQKQEQQRQTKAVGGEGEEEEETGEKQAQERVKQEVEQQQQGGAGVDEERERSNGDVDYGNADLVKVDKSPAKEGALRDETKDQTGHEGLVSVIQNIRTCKSVVLVVLVPIAIGLVLYNSDLLSPSEPFKVFSRSFSQVQAAFPGQTPRFWRILRNTATTHLKNPNPKKPLVTMLTAGPSAHNVLECIARKLAQTLEPDDNRLGHVNSTEYNYYSSLDDAKNIMDEKLEQFLQKGLSLI